MLKVTALLLAALMAGLAGGRTTAEFSSTTANSANSFSAAASFGGEATATARFAKTTAATTSYNAAVGTDSPIAYWRFDEAVGVTTAADSSGNGRNAVYGASVQRGQGGALGDANTAARWPSASTDTEVPHDAGLNLNGAFSVELWIKLDTFGTGVHYERTVMAKGTGSPNAWRVFYMQGRTLAFARNFNEFFTTSAVPADRWTHAVYTNDGTTARWYLDGVLNTSATISPGTNNGTLPLRFGATTLSGGEAVSLDEVALYATALSAARVNAHYNTGKMLFADPCESYYAYTNITDGGSPVTGVSSVTADLSAITPGSTAVAMTAGSYTVGGVAYSYRSTGLRARVAPGSYSFTVTWVDGAGTHTQTGLSAVVDGPRPVGATWTAGFEHGQSNLNTPETPGYLSSVAGNIWVYTTVRRTGLYSLRSAKDSNTAAYGAKTGFTATTALTFAVHLATLPTADVTSLAYFNTSSTPLYLGYQASSQKLTLRWGSNTAAVASSTVTAATWYVIDLHVDVGANPNTAAWRVNEVDQPPVNLSAAAQTVVDFRFGSAVSADRFTAHYDDVVQSPRLYDYPLGPVAVSHRTPNVAGTHSNVDHFQQYDGTAITSTTHNRLSNIFGSNDGVRQATASSSSYLEFGMTDTTAHCIRGVQAHVGVFKGGSQASHLRSVVVSGGTELTVHDGDATGNMTAGFRTVAVQATLAAWSQAEFNALLFRIGYSIDISPLPYWNGMRLEYAATP